MSDEDPPIVPPPASVQADLERRPVLYLADGRALVRRIGFNTEQRPKDKA